MKKCWLILGVSSLLLSGCNYLTNTDIESKQKEVEEYNKLVSETLDSFTKIKLLAESKKQDMISYALTDTTWDMATKANVTVTDLTPAEKESFTVPAVVHDKFFTATGSEAAREVLIINGLKHKMYLTVIWGKDGLLSFERKVVES